MTPILDKIAQSDGVVFRTPIYYGDITGVVKSCVERLLFPLFEYKEGFPSIAPKKLKTAIIYTMNVDEKSLILIATRGSSHNTIHDNYKT